MFCKKKEEINVCIARLKSQSFSLMSSTCGHDVPPQTLLFIYFKSNKSSPLQEITCEFNLYLKNLTRLQIFLRPLSGAKNKTSN